MRLEWLTARPIAHRGLHGGAVLENTLEAADAAAAANYAIECDIQLTADGEIVVFHDDTLERLTVAEGPLRTRTLADLKTLSYRNASGRIPELKEFLGRVAGRTPVLIEMKSRWDGDTRIAERAAAVVANYSGPFALMSFDPWLVRALRRVAPALPRGIVAERYYNEAGWRLDPGQKWGLGNLTHIGVTWPHFIAYWVRDLPAFAPLFARNVLGMPLLTWTVRTAAEQARAARWADQMIFEGFRP
ncbi:MAG TPA: glycerophosphodiester phosphodiesterase family protein [Xanthobacteraceae bacterium]|nr:glycerophosphodiester phosphodiesterase family protein [Xanthobacteraceae bacterium]